MMQRFIPILLLPLMVTSCLKSDTLDQPEDINFLRTEFYQQHFDDFSFDIINVDFKDPRFNSPDSTFIPVITYRLPKDYMESLFDNWAHTVEMESNTDTRKLQRGTYEFTDTLSRKTEGTAVNFTLTLKVQKVFKVMATTEHTESFVVK